jgi:hypothetical protein
MVINELLTSQSPENHILVAHQIAWMKWRHRVLAWGRQTAWVVALAVAIATLIEQALVRRRLFNALHQGICLTCGYDLRASNDRCPECGTSVPAAAQREPFKKSAI